MINRTFFVSVATRWIPTLYSILCPYEAAKILCPALCVSWSWASAWLQVMAVFQKGHHLGQDSYTGSVRDSLHLPASQNTPSLQPCLCAPRFPALPCLAVLVCSIPETLPQPWASSTGQGRIPGCWSRFLLPHLSSRPSSLPGSTSYFSSLPMAKAT